MDKKEKLNAFMTNAGKGAKDALGKTMGKVILAVDQNDDGKFDMEDVSAVAGNVSTAVKNGAQILKETAEEKSRQLELKALQPIFPDTLDEADFTIPKCIRIADRDKKHAESELCKGSIGHVTDMKDLRIVTIYRDSLSFFNLSFLPDEENEFYYMNPSDRDSYIALNEYFGYLKTARVAELGKIAQDLGAKHFRVTYKEEQKSFEETKGKIKVGLKAVSKDAADAGAEHLESERNYCKTEIESEMSFPGHEPKMPELRYMQKDPSIKSLVDMRMDSSSPLVHQKYMLKMSISSGIKESDALKIDAALKGFKCTGNASVVSEAQNEARRYLEYEIDF